MFFIVLTLKKEPGSDTNLAPFVYNIVYNTNQLNNSNEHPDA